jgi:hypothetical protein
MAQVNTPSSTDEALIARVAKAILVELGHVDAAPAAKPDPEYMVDHEIRQRLVRVSRSRYFELIREPDYPAATRIGRFNYRRVADVRRWLEARQVT